MASNTAEHDLVILVSSARLRAKMVDFVIHITELCRE